MGATQVAFKEDLCTATCSAPATYTDLGAMWIAPNEHGARGGNRGVDGDPTTAKTYVACGDGREADGESAVTKVPETRSGGRGVDEDAVAETCGNEAVKDKNEIDVEEPPRENAKPIGKLARLFGRGRGWRCHDDAFELNGHCYGLGSS
jgi:hypothetical protein